MKRAAVICFAVALLARSLFEAARPGPGCEDVQFDDGSVAHLTHVGANTVTFQITQSAHLWLRYFR